MAGNGTRRDRRRGRRWIIAASFAGQAAIIAVVAAGSARGTSAAVSVAAGPAVPASAAPAGPPPPAPVPPTPVPPSAVPLPPGEIGVTVSAAGQGGAIQSGDIGFPAPEDPPLLVIRPGADTAITVDLAIPPGARVRGLSLGIAAGQGTGDIHVRWLLRASMNASPAPGRYAYVLHWARPAGTPAGGGNLLVLNVRHAGGADDQAPIAELVAG